MEESYRDSICTWRPGRREFGTLDILVNNAGLQRDSKFQSMTLDEWNRVLSINLTGQFLCARAAVREFVRRGIVPEVSCAAGKIIRMSSVHQQIPWAGHANYATSKGGIKMLMESLAQEVAPLRIRVNAIAPGAIRTPINTSTESTFGRPSGNVSASFPRRRWPPIARSAAATADGCSLRQPSIYWPSICSSDAPIGENPRRSSNVTPFAPGIAPRTSSRFLSISTRATRSPC